MLNNEETKTHNQGNFLLLMFARDGKGKI